MKNLIKILNMLVLLGLFLNLNAQHRDRYSYNSKKSAEKTEHKAKEDILIEKLVIGKDKEVAFKEVFRKYDEEAMAIIRDSRKGIDKDNPSDKEIKDRIYAKFNTYQKLLNHRKAYVDKFLKILSPRQLEKMFDMEKQIGRIAIEKRHQMDKSKLEKKRK